MRTLILRLAAVLAVISATPAMAMDMKATMAGDLKIEKAWARASIGTSRPSAAFMMITNMGKESDRLVSAATEMAGKVEIHETTMEAGVMKMRHKEDGIEIPAGETVELKPKGLHVMIMGLKQPLEKGGVVELTLTFEKAGEAKVKAMIMEAGATMMHKH